jgi:hypothetical protein
VVFRKHYGPKARAWEDRDEHKFISSVEVLCWRLSDEEFLLEYLSMASFEQMFGKAAAPAGSAAATDVEFAKKYPNLSLLLTCTTLPNGKVRQTATMTIVAESGLWKGGVKDRDHSMSLWRSGETIDGLLTALETALESGQADWRIQESRSRKSGA